MIKEAFVPNDGGIGNVISMAPKMARLVAEQSRPSSPLVHLIKGGLRTQLFIPNGSRLYTVSDEVERRISGLMKTVDEAGLQQELVRLGLAAAEYIDDTPLQGPRLYALSLAIAQKCNMGCTYCYADQGSFGGASKNMSLETACEAIDLLLKDCPEGEKIQLTFLGGEPLMNRKAIVAATEYAVMAAQRKDIRVSFSITTNGTLVTEADAIFFEQYGFAVTVSLDGVGENHDQQRPMKGGRGSFDTIVGRLRPLLSI